MSKRLKCKLNLHHWHYDTFIIDGWLYAQPKCYYCEKEGKLYTCSSFKEWFSFSNNWADILLHKLKEAKL